ncbi:MAG: hypothetical protein LBV55_02925 [Acholeplasmatales bacterium]|nr:hypothetical protein [Acholeplasmatales bacterium]
MSLNKYRTIDLVIFTVIVSVLDVILLAISVNVINFYLRLYISFSLPLIAMIYVRWHKYGLISNVILMVVHTLAIYFLTGMNLEGFLGGLANGLSLGFIALTLWWIYYLKKNANSYNIGNVTILYLAIYLLMWGSEYGLNVLFGNETSIIAYALFHLLNLFLGYGIMLLVLKTKGLFIYQIEYLLSIQKREKND